MRKRIPSGAKFLRKHWVAAALICSILALATVGNFWYAAMQLQQIHRREASTLQLIKEAKAANQTYKDKIAAEEKAKQEENARQAAEAAKKGDVSPENSKVCNAATAHTNPASIDVVVNKKHCIQPLNYVPANLVTTHGATITAQAATAFNEMFTAAAADGQPFYVTSSYRSYTTQISTYNHWISISGQAGADTYSARPGYSEHQTGLAFDVAANGCTLDCFGSTSQYEWFQRHAAEYGFIQRYYAGYEAITGYKAEEWHYRYVGVSVAKDMQARGVKTLEQYWNIPGGDY